MSLTARGLQLELEGNTEVQVRDTVAEFSEGTDVLREEVTSTEEEAPIDTAVVA